MGYEYNLGQPERTRIENGYRWRYRYTDGCVQGVKGYRQTEGDLPKMVLYHLDDINYTSYCKLHTYTGSTQEIPYSIDNTIRYLVI